MLAFTISFFHILFLMQKHLREVTPVSDRKGLWGRRVSGLFFLQTDGGKGRGGAVFLLWWQEKPALLLPSPTEVCLSLSFLLTNLYYIMNHRSYPSSAPLCGYVRRIIFLSIFLSLHVCMGPTLLHSWSSSNSSPTPFAYSTPPYCLALSFYVFVFKSRLSQQIECVTIRFFSSQTSNICHGFLFPSPFLVSKRGEKMSWMLTLFVSNSSAPLHSFSLSFQRRNSNGALAASSGILPGAQSEHLTSSLVFVFPTHSLIVCFSSA